MYNSGVHHRERCRKPDGNLFFFCALAASVLISSLSGCGTTRWSDSSRTGTEQLLISSAIDAAVGKIDFSPMKDKRVFLITDAIEGITDQKYLTMSLRHRISASGSILCDSKDKTDYIIEVRAGAVGTDRDEMLVGVPSFTVPAFPGSAFSGSIPEIPIVKRTKQRGVAKIAVFAYNSRTGLPVWASGNSQSESTTDNLWFAGTGPLTKGNIYEHATFAGNNAPTIPWRRYKKEKTFADTAAVFDESPNALPLTSPSPVLESIKKAPENKNVEMMAANPGFPPPLPAQPVPQYASPYVSPYVSPFAEPVKTEK
jgi:hypothetical protein